MKRINTILIFILTVIIVFPIIIFAQDSVTKNKIDEKAEQEKREVEKFADSFIKSFIQNKDISKVPKSFFSTIFKSNFIKDETWNLGSGDKDIIDQLNDAEKFKDNVSLVNFWNLLMVACIKKAKKPTDDENIGDLQKLLPNQIVKIIKKSKWLHFFIDDGEGIDPKNLIDWRSFMQEVNTISEVLKKYLEKNPLKSFKQFAKIKRFFEYYPSDLCTGKDCMGLPENTPIFIKHEFSMCLRIAKIDGKLKIINLHSIFWES